MNIREYKADKDFSIIQNWITDERTHAMWCANRTSFPLQRESFDSLIKDIAERSGDRPFVAVDDDGSIVGFYCYSINKDTYEGMLKFVMVDPQKRGKGLGREMIRQAVNYAFDETGASAVQLMVLSANARAKRCYESVGFKERRIQEGAFTFQNEVWDRCNMVLEKKKFKAVQLFSEKMHCSQSVLAAFAEECGITEEMAFKLGSCFGSGMRKGNVCGACTGALMVLGLLYGEEHKGAPEERQRSNKINDMMMDRFKKANGTCICNELLGCDITTPEGVQYARENGLFKEFCPKMVASAVDILNEIICEIH